MKSNKKLITIIIAAVVVVVVAVIVFIFFNDIFKVQGEAKPVTMELPTESQILTTSLDYIKIDKISWKEALTIKGWVYKQNVKEKNRELFLVLISPDGNLIFDIEKDNLPRPDVNKYFNVDASVTSPGFEVHVPSYRLKDGHYKVGFILTDESGKYYAVSAKELDIAGGEVTVSINKATIAKPKTSQVYITLQPPTTKVKCGFEKINIADNTLTIGGWAFLDGTNTDGLKIYVVLKKGADQNIYATMGAIRKDVTNVYKKSGINVDASGFAVKIPVETLQKGHYQIGVYLEKGNLIGLMIPRSVDIN
jgi:hypothetical protein